MREKDLGAAYFRLVLARREHLEDMADRIKTTETGVQLCKANCEGFEGSAEGEAALPDLDCLENTSVAELLKHIGTVELVSLLVVVGL